MREQNIRLKIFISSVQKEFAAERRALKEYLTHDALLSRFIDDGTGTTDMISDCREAGLPEPEFKQHGPHFVVTLWRDWLTEEVLARLDLNEQQMLAVKHLKSTGRISNSEYRQLTGASESTALRELRQLAALGIVGKSKETGQSAHYVYVKS